MTLTVGVALLAVTILVPYGIERSTVRRARALMSAFDADRAAHLARPDERPVHRGTPIAGNARPFYEPILDDFPDATEMSDADLREALDGSCIHAGSPPRVSPLEARLELLLRAGLLPAAPDELHYLARVSDVLARLPDAQRRTRCGLDRLPVDFSRTESPPTPSHDEENLARDAALVSRLLVAAGRRREAALMLTDALRACHDQRRVQVAWSFASEGDAILARELGGLIASPSLEAATLRELTTIADRLAQSQPPFADGLRTTRLVGESSYYGLLIDGEMREAMDRSYRSSRCAECASEWGYPHGMFLRHWLVGNWQRFRAQHLEVEALADLPLPARIAALRELCTREERVTGRADWAAARDARGRAWLAVLQAAVRVRIADLAGEPVPEAAALPADPRSGEPLRLERDGDRCRIASPDLDADDEPGLGRPWRNVAIELPLRER